MYVLPETIPRTRQRDYRYCWSALPLRYCNRADPRAKTIATIPRLPRLIILILREYAKSFRTRHATRDPFPPICHGHGHIATMTKQR